MSGAFGLVVGLAALEPRLRRVDGFSAAIARFFCVCRQLV